MLPDILSVVLRALSFIFLFQAAGAAMFVAAFGRELTHSVNVIRRLGSISAVGGVVLVLGHYALEAARMAGELSGLTDASLQRMVLNSTSGAVVVLRILGLLLVAIGLQRDGEPRVTAAVIGATLAILSFSMTGHTAMHPMRWLLAAILIIHLLVVAFWFGALLPLYFVSAREPMSAAAKIIDAFSRIAIWLVPGIFVAGIVLATVLIPDWSVLSEPYGEMVIAKLAGFALLMALAIANKWRLGPAISRGELSAARLFRRSVAIEYVLIITVLTITAVMTSLFSPEH